MELPFDLTCWYLNLRRISELTQSRSPGVLAKDLDFHTKNTYLTRAKADLLAWLSRANVEPLEKLLLENRLKVGTLFTHHTNFFFKGLSSVSESVRLGKAIKPATGYAKLDSVSTQTRLNFVFHHDHLTSNSAWTELAGQKRMFFVGLAQEISSDEIVALPYAIGNVVQGIFFDSSTEISVWRNFNEIHIDEIDTFSKVRNYHPRRTKKSLEQLKDIPEPQIKATFAEIINEPRVPKDWGGEMSDLFSSYVVYEGKRISTAFALKGPAKFRPMTFSELGKNGDQISRLYEEPADLLVLQHCHEITNPVRKMMRAFAQQTNNPRLCCIIDGYETLRILECYEKLGFSKSIVAT